MELFSGAPGRMLDALSALFACPQNNLRVFRNGNLIYGDHENSISCEELHSRVFQGEIMVLIKHLLVACLLREYSQDGHVAAELYVDPKAAQSTEVEAESAADEKTKAEAEAETETEAEAQAVEIGAPNVKATVDASAGAVDDIVKAAAGQPQRLNAAVVAAVAAATTTTATRAAAAKETQRYTKRGKVTKTTTATRTARQTTTESVEATMATATSTWESTTIEPSTCAKSTRTTTTTTANVAMATETKAETKTETEPLATQAQINTTEISCLPKNCVLQKILHLQFLVKRHFRYMAEAGYATQVTTTYNALRTLLAREKEQTQVQGIGYIDGLEAEQAYMLGATALDCSIMLTFREIQCQNVSAKELERLEPWHVHLANFQRHFIAKVSVLDLDPKPDSHFHKFIQQTREIEKCDQALN
ncbi:inositol-pentakisphosphate 2-kinase isoform X2 [Scaptodrosophila lebanonensis]|nr:inositol-pentakisphosphate 2-kinase isoform X2 [Scaptodrosophila lebanonensis]